MKSWVVLLFPLIVALTLSSCSFTLILEPEAECVYYDGTWSAVTSQGYPLTFEVVDNEVTSITLDYEVRWHGGATVTTFTFEADPYCSSCSAAPVPIEEGCFTASFDLPYGDYCSITGYFGSAYLVSGEVEVSEEYCCEDMVISWNGEVY
jgi:hypothetical protein